MAYRKSERRFYTVGTGKFKVVLYQGTYQPCNDRPY